MNNDTSYSKGKSIYLMVIIVLSFFLVVGGTSFAFFSGYNKLQAEESSIMEFGFYVGAVNKGVFIDKSDASKSVTLTNLNYNSTAEKVEIFNTTINLNITINGNKNDICYYNIQVAPISSSYKYERSTSFPLNNSSLYVATSSTGGNLYEYTAQLKYSANGGSSFSNATSELQLDYIDKNNVDLVGHRSITVSQTGQPVKHAYRLILRMYNLRDYNQDKLVGTSSANKYLRYHLKVSALTCDWEHW